MCKQVPMLEMVNVVYSTEYTVSVQPHLILAVTVCMAISTHDQDVLRKYLVTIYSDDCSSNATAARIGTCTTLEGFLQIASYSVDCPGNNGPLEDYTTSFAAAAQTTTKPPTLSESTSSQERPQDSTTSTQSPSFSESTSSSQEPQALPTTSQSPSSSSTSPTSSTSSLYPLELACRNHQAHAPQVIHHSSTQAPRRNMYSRRLPQRVHHQQ